MTHRVADSLCWNWFAGQPRSASWLVPWVAVVVWLTLPLSAAEQDLLLALRTGAS